MNLLHIDLNHGDLDLKLHLMTRVSNLFENVANHSRYHTPLGFVGDVRTQHGMGFPATRLSICEHRAIEPFHDAFDDWFHSLFVDEALWRV